MSEAVGQRLRGRIQELGISEAEAARRCDLSQRRLSYYLSGEREPDFDTLERILRTLELPPNVAFGFEGNADIAIHNPTTGETTLIEAKTRPSSDHLPNYTGDLSAGVMDVAGEDYASIPRFDARLSAGPGSLMEAEPDPLGYHLVELQWLRSVTQTAPKHLVIVMVDGDSMEPTLMNRDWVLIDTTQKRIQRQGIFGLRFHDTTWIKRLQPSISRQSIRILSDNPNYEPDEAQEDQLDVIGRAVSVVARALP